ncbi:hypothetical protein BJ085DRAFT_31577 [Dimargaris cristalligena]|uniref:Uncharacterized protein n=1 Tax=Dimargaris cristalligena TaxID=215637 RepID=A0A4P9ZLH9_9FUNG|nr:hypothetical protein BJ085DRAFT_31577 [Dimargaris cristalligena]|eukprot:RKP33341.1 hypothetical protein BJ085DRAFT_31577 [Dimargaris cristalligena]
MPSSSMDNTPETHVNCMQLSVVATKYKPVGTKVHPSVKPIPDDFQLATTSNCTSLDTDITPGTHLTPETEGLLTIGDGELTPTEVAYFLNRLREVEFVFAFNQDHLGLLHSENFQPYSVPRALFDKIQQMLRVWLESGIIEPSIGPYASRWFTILKKDKENLRFIQDFQPVNAVTI